MELTIRGHEDRYAVEQLQLCLFPQEEGEAVSALYRGATWLTASTRITWQGRTASAQARMKAGEETVRLRRRLLQVSYYKAAVQLLPELPPWGGLAGVRPTKLSSKFMLEGHTQAQAAKFLRQTYFVTEPRAKLCAQCSQATADAAALCEDRDLSVYVGIPFCPSRCVYCSFVSSSIARCADLLEPFYEKLLEEIEFTGKLLKQSGKRVRTLYIGGGTPTTLSASQLSGLLEALHRHFDLSDCLELTLEGGRPDTLDADKFRAMKNGGATRISINPQTMEPEVLSALGRKHSPQDILRAYGQAVEAGFTEINMDLIAGLPRDSVAGFARSLDAVMALHPSNITVHTLALKKGADLYQNRQNLPAEADVARMVDLAGEKLTAAGYRPYYLYRQKYMSGSFENVGWSRDNSPCLYNIYMMEELHSIVSLGGGGMNKVNLPGGKIERFHNPKFPQEYLSHFEDILRQKEALFQLLSDHT